MQTNYAYAGQIVNITAQSSSKILNMSRKLNGMGQLVSTSDANFSQTKYAYDGSGNPIALADPDGNTITTSFNALGQKDWVHDPNAGNSNFDYNSLGELEWQQDANGDVITYGYDDLGRILNRWTNASISGEWRYDSVEAYGRKGMIDYERNSSTTADTLVKYYLYATTSSGKDYLSNNLHTIYENGAATVYDTTYHVDGNFGRPKGINYGATGITIRYDFNSLGYMTHIENAQSGYVYREVTALDALGNITGSSMGDGVMTQVQAFHPATGQMTRNQVTKTSGGSNVHQLEYDYDGFGNLSLSQVTASNGLHNFETFDYDNLHRLIKSDRAYSSEVRPNDLINYSYNQLGNITAKDDYFGLSSYGNAAKSLGGNAGPNAIRQITYAWGGTTSYTYDNNGNMLTGDGRTMTYNEFNKPLTIAKGGVTSAFSYGANLLRYKQVKTGLSGGTQTSYYVDKLLEIEKQGTRTTYRHYFDGVAILHKEVVGATTNWTMAFNLKDRLGSVVTLADESGNVLEHRSYDPFGKPRRGDFVDALTHPTADAGTIHKAIELDPHIANSIDPLTDRGFTDHEHLDEQDIIHMNGRVFDYNIGRFSSVDPLLSDPTSSQSINPYSYIMNNPLSGTDPTGYQEEKKRTDEPATGTHLKNSRVNGNQTRSRKGEGNGSGDPAPNFSGDGGAIQQGERPGYDTSQPIANSKIRNEIDNLGNNTSRDLFSLGKETGSGSDLGKSETFKEAMTNALTGQGLEEFDDPAETMAIVTAGAALILAGGGVILAETEAGAIIANGFGVVVKSLRQARADEVAGAFLDGAGNAAALTQGSVAELTALEAFTATGGAAVIQTAEAAAIVKAGEVAIIGTTIVLSGSK